jgi:predicted anti-sigma-YlaC factor YlaD
MQDVIRPHLSEELLDEYVRRPLSTEAHIVEEHLLLCERCRDNVSELEEFVRALRYVFTTAERSP